MREEWLPEGDTFDKTYVVMSYPQSGRVWTVTMIGKIFNEYFFDNSAMNLHTLNVMHRKDTNKIPKIVLGHEDDPSNKPYHELHRDKTYLRDMYKGKVPSSDFRVIFLSRNPRDLIVSHWNVKRWKKNSAVAYYGPLSDFIREEHGSLDNIIEWYNIWADQLHKPDDFMLLRYEDLHSDGVNQLRRITDFLRLYDIPDSILESAYDFARFENMKKIEKEGHEKYGFALMSKKFEEEKKRVREGKTDKGHTYFSVKDNRIIDKKMKRLDPFYRYK